MWSCFSILGQCKANPLRMLDTVQIHYDIKVHVYNIIIMYTPPTRAGFENGLPQKHYKAPTLAL